MGHELINRFPGRRGRRDDVVVFEGPPWPAPERELAAWPGRGGQRPGRMMIFCVTGRSRSVAWAWGDKAHNPRR